MNKTIIGEAASVVQLMSALIKEKASESSNIVSLIGCVKSATEHLQNLESLIKKEV